MALHDPVQDDINRQIRSAIPARTRSRRFGIAGQVEDLVSRGELTPEAGERISLNARANFERDRRIASNAEEARQAKLEESRSLAEKRKFEGQSRLVLANAALAKTRAGGDRIGEEGLAALGFSPEDRNRFSGNISPTTARTASTSRAQVEAAAIRQQSNEVARQQKRIDNQRQNNIRNNQNKVKEDRLKVQAEIAALDKGLQSTSPEDIAKIKEVFDRLVGETTGVPLPADQVETYRAAAKANLPADATEEELGEEATRLAEEDGFAFLP